MTLPTAARRVLLGVALACAAALAVDRLVAAGVATSVAQLGVLVSGIALIALWYRRVTAAGAANQAPAGGCVHGQLPDASRPRLGLRGRRRQVVERHEAECRAHLFWHWHGLRRRVCCATCGRNVA